MVKLDNKIIHDFLNKIIIRIEKYNVQIYQILL